MRISLFTFSLLCTAHSLVSTPYKKSLAQLSMQYVKYMQALGNPKINAEIALNDSIKLCHPTIQATLHDLTSTKIIPTKDLFKKYLSRRKQKERQWDITILSHSCTVTDSTSSIQYKVTSPTKGNYVVKVNLTWANNTIITMNEKRIYPGFK